MRSASTTVRGSDRGERAQDVESSEAGHLEIDQ